MTSLRNHMSQFKESYLSEDHSHMSVNEMWVKFKTGFLEAVERFIKKNDQKKYSLPWLDATIQPLMKRCQKLYLCDWKPNDPDVKNHYKRFRAHVQKVEREMPIGNTFPMFSRLRTTPQIRIQIKVEKLRSFGHLSNHWRKTHLGSHHLGKAEFWKHTLKKKLIFANGNSNLPSRVRQILTCLKKGLVHSPPWGK